MALSLWGSNSSEPESEQLEGVGEVHRERDRCVYSIDSILLFHGSATSRDATLLTIAGS